MINTEFCECTYKKRILARSAINPLGKSKIYFIHFTREIALLINISVFFNTKVFRRLRNAVRKILKGKENFESTIKLIKFAALKQIFVAGNEKITRFYSDTVAHEHLYVPATGA